jgi:hypothetical protein
VDELEDGNVSAPPSLLIHREIEVAFLDHTDDARADIETRGLQRPPDRLTTAGIVATKQGLND